MCLLPLPPIRPQLAHNEITTIPPTLGKCTNLQALYLAQNKVEKIPRELCGLTNLQTLQLNMNPLTALPDELRALTALKELSVDERQRHNCMRVFREQWPQQPQGPPKPPPAKMTQAQGKARAKLEAKRQTQTQQALGSVTSRSVTGPTMDDDALVEMMKGYASVEEPAPAKKSGGKKSGGKKK